MTPAHSVYAAESQLFHILLQLIFIVLAARLGGVLARRMGQAMVVGEILFGILLGPSSFGWIMPEVSQAVFRAGDTAPIFIMSQLGLLLLMFQIGMEFDFSHLGQRGHKKTVLYVAICGLVAPFVLGFTFAYYTASILSPAAPRLPSALFVATAFSITALPTLGRILLEFQLATRPIGVMAISAAAINDVAGWLLLAIITSWVLSQFQWGSFGLILLALTLYVAINWWVVRPLLKKIVRRLSRHENLSHSLISLLLAYIFVSGMITQQLGIFTIFGGFVAGVMLYDEHALVKAWRDRVGHFVLVFFLPIFFTYTGLRTNIRGLDSWQLWGFCLLVLFLAMLGKFGASYWAARQRGLPVAAAKIFGILMNTRALMELVVLNVGYDLGVISQNMFTMLVIMAVVTTVTTTPALRRWLPQLQGTRLL